MVKADIGLIGLAVMGQNLVLNMNDHGFRVAVFNRTVSRVDEFLAQGTMGTPIRGAHSLRELVGMLKRPRRVMMLVQAGSAVDGFIEQLLPLLEKGDIIIDDGNSNYGDTIRRTAYGESHGLLYIGTGVSGGEEGALLGPSILDRRRSSDRKRESWEKTRWGRARKNNVGKEALCASGYQASSNGRGRSSA